MEGEEYMNRKSRKQRGEAEVSVLITLTRVIVRESNNREKEWT
jgi:hypothetical protein